jgi:methionyl aminopeptidase
MDEKIKEKYIKAGKIAAQARDYGASLAKPGIKLLDLAEAIERKIEQLGGKPAFPVNLSLNAQAAHYTPYTNDPSILKADDYLKIDVGVHIDGYIGDTAITVRPAGKDKMIECSEKMLEEALKLFVPGEKLSHIGEVIENIAKKHGFNPVANLTGHRVEQFSVHSPPGVLNVKNNSDYVLQEGDVFGVEPFCTNGAGRVKDSTPVLIYAFMADKPVRSFEGRKIIEMSKVKYNGLPFAKRWIEEQFSPVKATLILRQLAELGALHPYPILREVADGNVAQSEHTVIVSEKPIITTRI